MKKIKLYSKQFLFIIIIVLIAVISTVSYTFSTMTEAKQQVTQDITDFARGTYDILIRPPNARTQIEKQLHVIEENYLGIGDGGITLKQWESIKNHPQVEIAAPVASIGLFTARERTWMINKEDHEAKYYEIAYFTSDGFHTYPYLGDVYVYDFGNTLGEFLIYPSTPDVADDYLGYDISSFLFPLTYHQVVAVDPMEEGKLINYDFTPLKEDVFDDLTYEGGRYSLPIMSLKDVTVPVSIKLTIDELDTLTEEEFNAWNSKFFKGNHYSALYESPEQYYEVIEKYVSKKRKHQEENYEFIPDEYHSPFKQSLLNIDEDMKLSSVGDIYTVGGAFDYHSQRIGYRLPPVKYEIKEDNMLHVKQTGVDELYGVPLYRTMEEVEFYELDEHNNAINNDDFFGFVENGTFSIKENTKTLASAPLGIYGSEAPRLASDESVTLHPSAVPGSFITTPAHGLISIEHAEKAKGEAPIDAIRVKVAGITGYDKQAATLIRELAEAWEKEGFTVDIVAGASLQDMTVEVEGLGKVIQPFTTLGAADTVLSSWNVLQVVLTVLYSLVALTFIGFTFFNLLADRKKDEQLLARLGWSEKLIRRIRYQEWAWMIGLPVMVVVIGFTVFGFWQGQWQPLVYSFIVSGICFLLYVIAELAQGRKHERQTRSHRKNITTQNIWFYRFNLLASCVQLILITILTSFLPFFIQQNVRTTTETRLGTYIHGEIEGMFIIVLVLLYTLSLITVYQSLQRLWEKRKPEINLFLYLGWGRRAIRRYFMKEVLIWAGLTSFIGYLISMIITAILVEVNVMTVLLGLTGIVLVLAITLVGALYSLQRAESKGGDKLANKAS